MARANITLTGVLIVLALYAVAAFALVGLNEATGGWFFENIWDRG